MKLDVDIESTFRFPYMKCIDKQKDITMKQLLTYKHLPMSVGSAKEWAYFQLPLSTGIWKS